MDRDQDTMTDRERLKDRDSTQGSTLGSGSDTTVVEATPSLDYQTTDANYRTRLRLPATDSSYQQESSYQTDSTVTGDDDDGEQGKEALGAGAGALGGAAIGTAVAGPVGTVVGGAIGAVGGAVAGEAVDSDSGDGEEVGSGGGALAGGAAGALAGGAIAGPPGAVVGGAVGAAGGAGAGDKTEENLEGDDYDRTERRPI